MNFNFEIVSDKPMKVWKEKNKMNNKRLVCEQWAKHREYINTKWEWKMKCCGVCCETDIQIDSINATQRQTMCEWVSEWT